MLIHPKYYYRGVFNFEKDIFSVVKTTSVDTFSKFFFAKDESFETLCLHRKRERESVVTFDTLSFSL